MDNNWAAENLQTIRTLMERSAVYRRALAPITTFVGGLGIVASLIGYFTSKFDSLRGFSCYWMAVSLLALGGALLLVRRQAIKDSETLWSPPTRRVAQGLLPPLLVGMVIGVASATIIQETGPMQTVLLSTVWATLYGLALRSAGFFMPRGIRLFAWFFIVGGCAFPFLLAGRGWWVDGVPAHLLMGAFFGTSHLAYGIYLYFTERKNEA